MKISTFFTVILFVAATSISCGGNSARTLRAADGGKPKMLWFDAAANFKRFASQDSIRYYLDRTVECGFNHIVVDVRPISGTVLYESDMLEPLTVVGPDTVRRDWDYLQCFLDEARKRELKVTVSTMIFPAGFTTFRQGAAYSDPELAGRTCVEYTPEGRKDIKDDPTKVAAFLNPVLPENQEYVLRFAHELLTKYKFDGYALDYCRFPDAESDFSPASREAFETYLGHGIDRFPEDIFTYDANGMRLSKSEVGNGNRSTLEELLRGNIAGLPEIVEPAQSQTNANGADAPTELEWATTEYLYDLTQEYYQVISETTTSASGTSATTAYAYGLERIAAYNENGVTRYVYDGRGSVAQTVNAPVAGAAVSSALPDISVKVQSFAYTAFGEQMGGVKVSGFTYNAEAYDAATGMLNLRARQFEPALGRFSQKDIVRGQAISPLSLNRYAYCVNDPLNLGDPSGMLFKELISSAKNLINKVTASAKKAVKTATAYVKAAVQKTVIDHAQLFGEYAKKYYDLDAKTQGIIREAANKLSQIDMSTAKGRVEASAIFISACTLLKGNSGSKATVNTPTAPMPTPAPTPTPSNPQPTPAPTRPEGWDVMFIGPDAAKRLQEYLIPRYNQAAKAYNNLSGKNTFEPIPIDKTLYEKYVKPVGTAINQYVLSPIWQMAVEDWNSIMTSADARYNALINDFSFYNALNYATAGIPDVVVGIYQGYATRYIAFRQDPNVSTFLNWWTSGLSGELETTWNTPMSDPDYWRAVRNLVGVEAGAIGAYNVYTNWIISNHPYTTEWMIQYGNKMGMQYGKVPAGTFDEAFDFENLWDMPEGGEIINGRKYSQHALERMAPDTPEVRAEQYARATEIAKGHGLQPGTYEYSSFVDKYVDPRGIPPSVVEDAIINGTKSPGNKPGTFVYETIDIRVVSNENGDIITVIPK